MAKNRLEIIASMKDDLSKTLKKIDNALDKANKSIKETGKSSKAAGRNVESLGRKMRTADKRSNGLYQTIKRLSRGLSNLKFLLGAAATAFGVFLTARAAKNVIETAAAVERLTAEIGTLLGDVSSKNLRDLNFAIRSMAVEGGQTLENEFKAAYDAISAGIPKDRLIEFLSATNKLAVAGVTNVATATDLLTSVLNSFNISVDDIDEVLDSLFMTVKFGKLRIEDLANSLGRLAPIAEKVGLSLDEMNAGVAVLTVSGLKTEEATTALRQLLSTLIDLTPKAVKGLDMLGMSDLFSLDAVREKGFARFIKDLAAATEGQQDKIALFVSNIRALTGALSLVNEGGSELVKVIDAMGDKAGAADKAFELTSKTLAFQLDRLKALVEAVKVDIGNLVLSPMFEGIKTFVDNVQKARVAFKKLTDEINELRSSGQNAGLLDQLLDQRDDILGALRLFLEETLIASLTVAGTAFLEIMLTIARLFADALASRLGESLIKTLSGIPFLGDALEALTSGADPATAAMFRKAEAERNLARITGNKLTPSSFRTGQDLTDEFNSLMQDAVEGDKLDQALIIKFSSRLGNIIRKGIDNFKQREGRSVLEQLVFDATQTEDPIGSVRGARIAIGTAVDSFNDPRFKKYVDLVLEIAELRAFEQQQEEIEKWTQQLEESTRTIEKFTGSAGRDLKLTFDLIGNEIAESAERNFGKNSSVAVALRNLQRVFKELDPSMTETGEVFESTGDKAEKSATLIEKLAKSLKKASDNSITFIQSLMAATPAEFAKGQISIFNALGLTDQAQLTQLKQDLRELKDEYAALINATKKASATEAGLMTAQAEGLEMQIKAKNIEIFRFELQQRINKAQKEYNEAVKDINIKQQGGILSDPAQFANAMETAQANFTKQVTEAVDEMEKLKNKYPELTTLIDLSKDKMLEVLDAIKQTKSELSQTNQFVNAFATSLTTATSLATEAGSIIGNNLGSAIDSVITGAKSIGEAFRDMAIGIVQDLAKVIVKMLIIQALSAVFPGAGIAAPSFFGIGANKGGLIPGFSRGGKVGGSGPDRDSVHAMLTPGEFVIRRSAVQALGLDLLTKLNNVRLPGSIGNVQTGGMQGYNQGGQVSQQTASPTPAYVVANERSMQSLLSGGRAAMIDFLRSNRDSFMGDSRHMM